MGVGRKLEVHALVQTGPDAERSQGSGAREPRAVQHGDDRELVRVSCGDPTGADREESARDDCPVDDATPEAEILELAPRCDGAQGVKRVGELHHPSV